MSLPKNETRQRYSQIDSKSVKPSYENLEDELINLYPQVDLLNSQLLALKLTLGSICSSCEIKDELYKRIAVEKFSKDIKLNNLTKIGVLALETAQIVAKLREDSEKSVLFENAVISIKMLNDHTENSEKY